jgi:two-component system OmpR family response regulator
MELVRAGREVHLTATEFKLLAFLVQNPRRVISREELIDTVW